MTANGERVEGIDKIYGDFASFTEASEMIIVQNEQPGIFSQSWSKLPENMAVLDLTNLLGKRLAELEIGFRFQLSNAGSMSLEREEKLEVVR
ncbi:hypothetical protein [Roseibium sp.]|uniref:hypothetical protein n=1 Tax=Roseibium sp. TaxID=1936156 RepID=UPI0026199F52|nr:hypothetical protein [Roseibium sp.]